ncbi:hypothetical protein UPYG_G00049920 [Umbra pygmaea]|uniref:SEA domain-containing protein n=1 Tax=Umbra pygmaea TaxID=75934 RepID=A0ABD0YDE9_UMBPY
MAEMEHLMILLLLSGLVTTTSAQTTSNSSTKASASTQATSPASTISTASASIGASTPASTIATASASTGASTRTSTISTASASTGASTLASTISATSASIGASTPASTIATASASTGASTRTSTISTASASTGASTLASTISATSASVGASTPASTIVTASASTGASTQTSTISTASASTVSSSSTAGATASITTLTTIPINSPSSTEGSLGLQFSLNQIFTSDLSNTSSPAFQSLSNTVVTAVNNIYSKIFPAFKRSFVRSFTSGSVVANMTLVFNTTASTPNTTSALAAFNNVTGLDVIANSTSVFVVPASSVPTVPASTVSSSSSAGATASITTLTTIPTNAPSSTEGSLGLQFSLNQTFISDLSNSSSPAFQNLANTVVTAVNKAYFTFFPATFKRSLVRSFTNGSTVTNMTLVFNDASSVPSLASAMAAFNNVTGLNVIANSTSVSLTTTSSTTSPPFATSSGGALQPTGFSLVALPVTLALLMVQLSRSV